MNIIVADSTPLIILNKLNSFDFLALYEELWLPYRVREEIDNPMDNCYQNLKKLPNLKEENYDKEKYDLAFELGKNVNNFNKKEENKDKPKGECAALILMQEKKFDTLLIKDNDVTKCFKKPDEQNKYKKYLTLPTSFNCLDHLEIIKRVFEEKTVDSYRLCQIYQLLNNLTSDDSNKIKDLIKQYYPNFNLNTGKFEKETFSMDKNLKNIIELRKKQYLKEDENQNKEALIDNIVETMNYENDSDKEAKKTELKNKSQDELLEKFTQLQDLKTEKEFKIKQLKLHNKINVMKLEKEELKQDDLRKAIKSTFKFNKNVDSSILDKVAKFEKL